jgi:Transcription factor S-II (TFIIS), central domain/SPOC domain
LGQWLSQNPNCAPVKPGSPHAAQLLSSISNKKNAQTQNSAPTTPTTPAAVKTATPIGDELFSNPVKINTGANATSTPNASLKSPGLSQPQNRSLNRSNSSVKSPSITLKSPPTRASPNVISSSSSSSSSSAHKSSAKQEVKKVVKKPLSEEKPASNSSSKSKIEYERMNVRNIFKTTLIQRMQEFEHATIKKMTDSEVEDFAKEIEAQMFRFFNKDTRDKYKVKFRSLKFNLSDTKNKTLIERICAKKLTPKQLAELPPSALASEELAKWREDENKHQLEIITKSELDALAQNKIVVKTHKGEEIIETKTAPADILVPVDDVESVIAKTVLSVEDPHGRYDLSRSISLNVSGGHSITSPLSSPSITSSTGRKSDHRSRSRSKSRGRDHHHHKSSKHKKSERHRSKSPKQHHHHSRDKSHGRSRDKSRDRDRDHSKKRSEDKHHRDKSRSNDLEKSSSSKSKDNRESSKDSKKHHHHHHKDNKEHHKEVKKEIKPEQEDVDLVGKILDSMGVHLDVSKPKETPEPEKVESEEIKPEVSSTEHMDTSAPVSMDPINEHQLQIEIYSGNMYMAEIAKFDVTASTVSGNVDDIIKLFPPQLEIVGRIEPKTVWDYLGKVKKLPGKELAVIRFASDDASNYFKLFSYLHTRQRYGVIKSIQPTIKDFYLITIEANRPFPSVLLPIVGPGFIEGEDHKPDLLIGVILKVTPELKVSYL